jgi:hypothetical protein
MEQAMTTSNYISGVLSDADKQTVMTALDAIQAKLTFLKDMTPEERRLLPKMGDKSRAFVQKCLEVAKQNPGVLPRNFDMDEYARDVKLAMDLSELGLRLQRLNEMLSDTMTAVGSDAYSASLVVYQAAKLAGKGGGLDENLDGLAKRFARKAKIVEKTAA